MERALHCLGKSQALVESALKKEAFAFNGQHTGTNINNVDATNAGDLKTYDSTIANRIRAIQPKFNALYNECFVPDSGSLLTNPRLVYDKTAQLCAEVFHLRTAMPASSEESMDCKLVEDYLNFVMKSIGSRFKFCNSDLFAMSLLFGEASVIFKGLLDHLETENGGENDNNPLH